MENRSGDKGTAATLASVEQAFTAYKESGGSDKKQIEHYEARIKELSAAATGVVEVKIGDYYKVVVSLVDYVQPAQWHIDIRSSYLTPIKETVKRKDASGRLVPEVVTRFEWCRASQGLQIPLSAWPDFVRAVDSIEIEKKSSS